jgi:hypothetical protein
MSVSSGWSAQHFSQANPAGLGQDDVPALLRRVADTIAELGKVERLDLVMHIEVTDDGNWPSITAYYTTDRPPPSLTLLPHDRVSQRSVP